MFATFEPPHDKINKMTWAPSKDSDQSESLLGAYAILLVLSGGGSFTDFRSYRTDFVTVILILLCMPKNRFWHRGTKFKFLRGKAKKKKYLCVSGFPTLPSFLARP